MPPPLPSTGVVDAIATQARTVTDVKLDEFYDKTMKAPNKIEYLQQLFLVWHFGRRDRLPDAVAENLLSRICDRTTSPKVVRACLSILLEASPVASLRLEELVAGLDRKTFLRLLPLYDASRFRGSGDDESTSKLFGFLKTPSNAADHVKIVAFLRRVLRVAHAMEPAHVRLLNEHFGSIVTDTSTHRPTTDRPTNALFRKSDKTNSVTELDGRPSQEFFTVLAQAESYTDDQTINVCVFSFLQKWMNFQRKSIVSGSDDSDRSDDSSRTALCNTVIDYCRRIVDQSYFPVESADDVALQDAALLEAIRLMDVVCDMCPATSVLLYASVKRLYAHLHETAKNRAQSCVVLTAVLQFLLHHAETVAFDGDVALRSYFTVHVSRHHCNNEAAFECVRFLIKDATLLDRRYEGFAKYFPCIFKILAWNPQTFLEDFLQILPACVKKSTVIEIFHLVLDLPCTSAALLTVHRSANASSQYEGPAMAGLLRALEDSKFKPMFTFMTRNVSGQGDTFNRLKTFHGLVQTLHKEPSVVYCSDIAHIFLRMLFHCIEELDDVDVYKRLLPVMLERIGLLYPNPKMVSDIQRVLAEETLTLFKKHPSLVSELSGDIKDYLSQISKVKEAELFYMHMVWIVGEYTSATYDTSCGPTIFSYYETLECIAYELIPTIRNDGIRIKLLSVLATTLTKLATRKQDILARTKLCLSKMNRQVSQLKGEEAEEVVARITELIFILRSPNVASIILNPHRDIYKQRHRDNTSVPFVLKSIHGLMSAEE